MVRTSAHILVAPTALQTLRIRNTVRPEHDGFPSMTNDVLRSRSAASDNASTMVLVGLRSNASGARPARAFRLPTSAAAGHANLEARGVAEMPIMPDAALLAAGAHDQSH